MILQDIFLPGYWPQRILSTGPQSEGPDAYEADAEQALAAAWHQGQQAQRQHPLQGQKWDVLSLKKIKKIVHCLLSTYFLSDPSPIIGNACQ